jgi:alpha-ribazole phosphatase
MREDGPWAPIHGHFAQPLWYGQMMVVLVRHMAVEVQPGTCYGRMDMPLRRDALDHVPSLAARICTHGIARVWTSPAARCRALADTIAALAATSPIIDPRLQELHFGAWEGVPWDMVPRSELDRWAATPLSFAPPGGESGQEFLDRVGGAHQAIYADGQDCVVVSHGGPLKVLAALFQGETPDLHARAPALGSVTVIATR